MVKGLLAGILLILCSLLVDLLLFLLIIQRFRRQVSRGIFELTSPGTARDTVIEFLGISCSSKWGITTLVPCKKSRSKRFFLFLTCEVVHGT
jgi:hypothetical protein